jgi:hypothetical protein
MQNIPCNRSERGTVLSINTLSMLFFFGQFSGTMANNNLMSKMVLTGDILTSWI